MLWSLATGRVGCGVCSMNGRNTPHTTPSTAKSSFGPTSIARSESFAGSNTIVAPRCVSVLTVASSPSRATTMSPSFARVDGDIVAARLGEDATVKTLTHRGATIVLEPANDSERAIEVGPKDDFAVLGVVCGVFRPFMEQTPQPTLPVASDQSIN